MIPVTVERGEGARLFDSNGRAYWDFYGGHAVALLGQGHPRLVAALAEQAKRLTFVSTLVPQPARDAAIQALCDFSKMHTAFLVNSGAEANEAALKLARKATGRRVIVALDQGFHGRTMACLGVTGLGHYRDDHAPVHGEARFVPLGDLDAMRRALGPDVAGVIVEPLLGIAGVLEHPPGYLTALRRLCDQAGAMLILDEIQTGIGRTGMEMAWHRGPDCRPDLVSVGKSLGCGFPVAALLMTEKAAASTRPGEHGTTFGGGPLATAVIQAVLGAIRDEGLLERARRVEARFREAAPRIPGVTAVRGHGCLLALGLDRPARPVLLAMIERGFVCGTASDPNCLRLCPPAVMPDEGVEQFLAALQDVLAAAPSATAEA
jgi:acetylornithine/succinyldiaminopimelate/putrescine aminotransferase